VSERSGTTDRDGIRVEFPLTILIELFMCVFRAIVNTISGRIVNAIPGRS